MSIWWRAGRGARHSTGKDLLLVAGVLLYNPGLARLLLPLGEFLPGGIKRFLPSIDIALVLRVVLIILARVAQAGARIAIKGGGAQAMFALIEDELGVPGIYILFF